MMAWKKSVLLRPAWPIRVLSDELLRSAAALGAMHTMRGAFEGFGNLRTAWFKSGQDVMPDVINKMRDDLGASKEVSLGDLFIRFEEKNGAKALQKLTEKTLGDVYGNRRIATRSIAGSSLALWALGPAGALTSASLYTLYARRTMASLARREIATTFYNDLRVSARTRLRTAKQKLRTQ